MRWMLDTLLRKARADHRVNAVILYGSRARGDAQPSSDRDICLVLAVGEDDDPAATATRLDYLQFHELDVRIYQSLPLYIRQRVLKDGKVELVKDEEALYETAFRTIREFEDFRPFYLSYLEEVANG